MRRNLGGNSTIVVIFCGYSRVLPVSLWAGPGFQAKITVKKSVEFGGVMKRFHGLAMAAAFAMSAQGAWSEDLVQRTELHRVQAADDAAHEVIVSRLEVSPGGTIPRHSHLGLELLVVVQGGQMRTGSGQTIDFPTGATAQFPEGLVHGGLTNIGEDVLVAITTHIVDAGQPLNIPAAE